LWNRWVAAPVHRRMRKDFEYILVRLRGRAGWTAAEIGANSVAQRYGGLPTGRQCGRAARSYDCGSRASPGHVMTRVDTPAANVMELPGVWRPSRQKIERVDPDCGNYVAEHKDPTGCTNPLATSREQLPASRGKKSNGGTKWGGKFGGKLTEVILIPQTEAGASGCRHVQSFRRNARRWAGLAARSGDPATATGGVNAANGLRANRHGACCAHRFGVSSSRNAADYRLPALRREGAAGESFDRLSSCSADETETALEPWTTMRCDTRLGKRELASLEGGYSPLRKGGSNRIATEKLAASDGLKPRKTTVVPSIPCTGYK